jgi:hypothetical protein
MDNEDKLERMEFHGGCHCGAVRFIFETAEPLIAYDCNCSVCCMTGYLHIIVPKDKFTLLSGKQSLTEYCWNTGVAKHLFCQHCGIKSFYIPRSNPNGIDINARCLTPFPEALTIKPFDGQHWEQNASSLAHLSGDD